MILRPKNWHDFQHYSKRNPPWIKLHRGLLDDFEFQSLPVASRALAPLLWLLASESIEGEIRADLAKVSFRLRMTENSFLEALKPLIDGGFIEDASAVLAPCNSDATPETETETETEKTPLPPSGGSSPSARKGRGRKGHLKLDYPEATIRCGTSLAASFPKVWLPDIDKPQGKTPATTLDEVMQRTDAALEAIHKADPKVDAPALLVAAFQIFLTEHETAKRYISGLGVWLSPNPKPGKLNYATYLPRAYRRLTTVHPEVVSA